MKKNFYVFYGTYMAEQMIERFPDAEFVCTGKIKNFRLMFKGKMPNSYATVEEWKGFYVPCVVWRISEEDERILSGDYEFKGYYYKTEIEVESDSGEKIICKVFIVPEDKPLDLPMECYIEYIRRAYEKYGFDLTLLEEATDFSEPPINQFNALKNF